MKKIIYLAIAVLAFSFIGNHSFAQHGRYHRYGKKSHPYHRVYNNRVYAPVPRNVSVYWATPHRYNYSSHVYFPDYQMFYDPYRGGYEYMNGNNWMFSATIPAFLANVNLGLARIQVMSGIPIQRNPHMYYNSYYRRYPPHMHRH